MKAYNREAFLANKDQLYAEAVVLEPNERLWLDTPELIAAHDAIVATAKEPNTIIDDLYDLVGDVWETGREKISTGWIIHREERVSNLRARAHLRSDGRERPQHERPRQTHQRCNDFPRLDEGDGHPRLHARRCCRGRVPQAHGGPFRAKHRGLRGHGRGGQDYKRGQLQMNLPSTVQTPFIPENNVLSAIFAVLNLMNLMKVKIIQEGVPDRSPSQRNAEPQLSRAVRSQTAPSCLHLVHDRSVAALGYAVAEVAKSN